MPSFDTPEALVRRVYAHYSRPTDSGVSTDRPGGAAFFTKALLDAFAKDSALSHGQVGAIDPDPICVCQDWGPLRVETVTVTGLAAGTVRAQVDFNNLGERETVVLTLSRTRAGWRIADIGNKFMTSVMAVLRASNDAAQRD